MVRMATWFASWALFSFDPGVFPGFVAAVQAGRGGKSGAMEPGGGRQRMEDGGWREDDDEGCDRYGRMDCAGCFVFKRERGRERGRSLEETGEPHSQSDQRAGVIRLQCGLRDLGTPELVAS